MILIAVMCRLVSAAEKETASQHGSSSSGGAKAAPGEKTIDPKTLPLPEGMTSNGQLGNLVGWTRGPGSHAEQMAKTQEVIKTLPGKLDSFKKAGLTKDIAQKWADFYKAETKRMPGNANAAARGPLMQAIADKL